MSCPICALRQENDDLKGKARAQLAQSGGSFIREESDRLVCTLYTRPTKEQHQRLLELLIEIDGTAKIEATL